MEALNPSAVPPWGRTLARGSYFPCVDTRRGRATSPNRPAVRIWPSSWTLWSHGVRGNTREAPGRLPSSAPAEGRDRRGRAEPGRLTHLRAGRLAAAYQCGRVSRRAPRRSPRAGLEMRASSTRSRSRRLGISPRSVARLQQRPGARCAGSGRWQRPREPPGFKSSERRPSEPPDTERHYDEKEGTTS